MRRGVMLVTCAVFALCAVDADAQARRSWKEWYGHFQGGWVTPSGDADRVLEDGWTIEGGATYRADGGPLGFWGSLGYQDFGVERAVLDAFESSGGDASIWQLTGGVSYTFELGDSFDLGLSGGIGVYRVEARLTEPGQVCGPICDPWYWWVCVPGCVPGTIVTDSESTTEFGWNIGAEFAFDVSLTTQLYLQVKYHSIDTPQVSTELIPVAFGVRF